MTIKSMKSNKNLIIYLIAVILILFLDKISQQTWVLVVQAIGIIVLIFVPILLTIIDFIKHKKQGNKKSK